MTDFKRVEDEAAHWLVREDRGLGLKERTSFEQWLSKDIVHQVSYLRLKSTWRRADRLSTMAHSLPRPRPSLWRHYASNSAWITKAAMAACVLLAGGALAIHLSLPQNETFTTVAGQHRSLNLSDGTKIELNGNTRLEAREAGPGRSVTLDHGLAYFDVVHDENHPFVVYAGNRRITDLGTKFSVYRNGDTVKVIVSEGRVRIETLDAAVAATVIADRNNVFIGQGDEVIVASQGQVNSAEAGPQPGLLIFNDEALDSVAKEFNRYNKKQIHVAESARNIKIGGSFRADSVDRFTKLLKQEFAMKVKEDKGQIYVSR
jgi:transmembrane sensor